MAAAYQSAHYGALTPGGGIFAALQSMGMSGTLLPVEIGIAATLAATVALVGRACGVVDPE